MISVYMWVRYIHIKGILGVQRYIRIYRIVELTSGGRSPYAAGEPKL